MLRTRWAAGTLTAVVLLTWSPGAKASDTFRLGLTDEKTPPLKLGFQGDVETTLVRGGGGHGGGGHGGGHGGYSHGGYSHGGYSHGGYSHGGYSHGGHGYGYAGRDGYWGGYGRSWGGGYGRYWGSGYGRYWGGGYGRYWGGYRPYWGGGYWGGYRPYWGYWGGYASLFPRLGYYSSYYPSYYGSSSYYYPYSYESDPTLYYYDYPISSSISVTPSTTLYSGQAQAPLRRLIEKVIAPPADPVVPPARSAPRDRTYPYDGGPRDLVPMPRADEPAPSSAPPAAVPLEGRSVSLTVKQPSRFAYPAYGEEPGRKTIGNDRTILTKKN